MPKAKEEAAEVEPGSVDELVHVTVLALRYQGIPQGTLVHDLSAQGLTPARIGELLDTKANTISQQKRRKRPPWPPTGSK